MQTKRPQMAARLKCFSSIQQSSATVCAGETCLTVGLLPFIISCSPHRCLQKRTIMLRDGTVFRWEGQSQSPLSSALPTFVILWFYLTWQRTFPCSDVMQRISSCWRVQHVNYQVPLIQPSNLRPASSEIFTAPAMLCVTPVCFLQAQPFGHKRTAPKDT